MIFSEGFCESSGLMLCAKLTQLGCSSSRIWTELWIAQQGDLHRKTQVIGITASLADRRWVGLVEVD
ncbi:hypothetical protein P4048_04080 [Pseudomonas aeruginosa]|nr:hypothetical protein [Pseudomonas aeruginosa]